MVGLTVAFFSLILNVARKRNLEDALMGPGTEQGVTLLERKMVYVISADAFVAQMLFIASLWAFARRHRGAAEFLLPFMDVFEKGHGTGKGVYGEDVYQGDYDDNEDEEDEEKKRDRRQSEVEVKNVTVMFSDDSGSEDDDMHGGQKEMDLGADSIFVDSGGRWIADQTDVEGQSGGEGTRSGGGRRRKKKKNRNEKERNADRKWDEHMSKVGLVSFMFLGDTPGVKR